MIGLMMFGFIAQANAQGVRNERSVRDVLRSLNSKLMISDTLSTTNSAEIRFPARKKRKLTTVCGILKESLNQFENKFQRRRENADDVTVVLSAAKTSIWCSAKDASACR
jgi:transposase-like protein